PPSVWQASDTPEPHLGVFCVIGMALRLPRSDGFTRSQKSSRTWHCRSFHDSQHHRSCAMQGADYSPGLLAFVPPLCRSTTHRLSTCRVKPDAFLVSVRSVRDSRAISGMIA